MLSTSTYYRSFVGRNISELPINETFYDDFVTFNAHLLSKKLLQFYRYFAESIFIYEIHKTFHLKREIKIILSLTTKEGGYSQ